MSDTSPQRRSFLRFAAAALGSLPLAPMALAAPAPAAMATRQVEAGPLDVAVHEAGPENGRPVILLHGFPYDIHSFAAVAPMLAAQGVRVIVPYLRGHGSTRFLDPATPRSGQQAALGQDVIDLMNALHIPEAVLAGFGWGGLAARVAAALRPTRVIGIVSANGGPNQDIARAGAPAAPQAEAGLW
ncbi:alpha/beta fold hydrolase [Massilia polaris]|uniref:alpha/beta fold hydrolase n=1 Tax=Massilia polaris TaxID=2728846 RepID=UPI00280501AF|nr:alpha/beta fold hydrolase [Massilia polaris]